MWIRTQDKLGLYDCDRIEVLDFEIIFGNPFDTYVVLAEYPTKERCIEVLDEIQEYIIGYKKVPKKDNDVNDNVIFTLFKIDTHEYVKLPTVYQMPEV